MMVSVPLPIQSETRALHGQSNEAPIISPSCEKNKKERGESRRPRRTQFLYSNPSSSSSPSLPSPDLIVINPLGFRSAMDDQVRLQRKTIRLVLEQCQKTLELLKNADAIQDEAGDGDNGDEVDASSTGTPSSADSEADELRELLKSKVESQDFLEKLGSIHMSGSHNISAIEDCASWDIISSKDLWEDKSIDVEQDGYVHVNKEDIVEAIACFMAAYLLSLKETKDFTPNQLQEALSKKFSAKGKKSKIRKAWDGSIVIYNVASWGATAIGMYHNPAIFRAASGAFWSSCHIISKLF